MDKPKYHIASFSGGKDSTAMVLRLIELGEPLDEVMFCDTTMEFPAMYRHVEKIKRVVESAGIKFTELRSEKGFEYYLTQHPAIRNEDHLHHGKPGYGWPGVFSRWCTKELKVRLINAHISGLREKYQLVQYIGIAADEQHRLDRQNNQGKDMLFPLCLWGWVEDRCLQYCYAKGYDWEGLYGLFGRVSCWCCPLQPLGELRKLRANFPDLWRRLLFLDGEQIQPFNHGKSVGDLDKRFALEDALTEAGESIKNKAFFADLKRLLTEEITIEEILQERRGEAGS